VTQQRTRLLEGSKPGNRRLGIIPGRRFALALVVCLGLLALTSKGAVADDSAPLVQATVYKAGGGTDRAAVTPDQLHANAPQCPTYTANWQEYGRQGPSPAQSAPDNSWTLATILGCLEPQPIALSDVTAITVDGDNGAPMTGPGSELFPADLRLPSDFQDSSQTPFVTVTGDSDRYDRPWRGESDLDFLDQTFTTPIAINVFEGPPLTVKALASPMTANVGSSINFNETVTGNGDGGAQTYDWNFGGGATNSSQATPTVQFNTAGVWTVNLQVTDSDGGGGGDQVTVTVNQPGTSSTPTSTGPTTTGPDKSSGTTPNAPPSTKKHKTGTQNAGKQHTGAKGEGKTSTHTHTTTTSTSTTTSTTTTQTTTTPAAGGSGGGSSGSSGSPRAGASTPTTPSADSGVHHRTPRAPTHHAAPTPAQGTLVTGELVSDLVPLPADQSPLVHPLSGGAAAAPARQAPESHSTVLPIIAAALAVLVLLGLGAQRELGWPRWWRDARWWRALRVLRLGG
jgi:PKD repeat protein